MFSNLNKSNMILSYTQRNFFRNILRLCQTSAKTTDLNSKEASSDPDMFVSDIENPYERKKHNPRLLSQFVSPYTGFIYKKHITGLCEAQQKRLEMAILRSRNAGYMPITQKAAKYLRDPKLLDPFAPTRPNPH